MILIDYSAIAIGNITAQRLDIEESTIRHAILNSLRLYRKKYNTKYGELVICCDGRANWRKKVFPEYKASRKIIDDPAEKKKWDEIWRLTELIKQEIKDNFPYKLLEIDKAEADDIIGTMAEYTNEFGNYEDIMIISGDKDFAQLQRYTNINQFSSVTKKPIVEKDPHEFLFKHICKGDSSDGVPNVLSPDNHFLIEGRQSRMTDKKISEWKSSDDMRKLMGEDVYRNYCRNKKMIDLAETPPAVKEEIINRFENCVPASASKAMPYMVKYKCRGLLEVLNDFIR